MSTPNSKVTAGKVVFGNDLPLTLIAGPCQLESRQHAFDMAGALKELCAKLGIGLVYKTSYDKANRTSLTGRRGAGLDAALPVFAAATSRSVWRDRKAGICRMSTCGATIAHCSSVWMSVRTGRSNSLRRSSNTGNAASRPAPRVLVSEVRLALS